MAGLFAHTNPAELLLSCLDETRMALTFGHDQLDNVRPRSTEWKFHRDQELPRFQTNLRLKRAHTNHTVVGRNPRFRRGAACVIAGPIPQLDETFMDNSKALDESCDGNGIIALTKFKHFLVRIVDYRTDMAVTNSGSPTG